MQAGSTLARDGYVGPVSLLSTTECRLVAAYLGRGDNPTPDVWEKARATGERFLYDLATRPAILESVTAALGPDVVLWGVSAVTRAPGERHPWHSDIESCGAAGGFVSVWIGIENTSRDSALQLVTRSHGLGRSLQQARAETGLGRDETTADVVLRLARAQDPEAELVEPEMRDGDAIFFDGRLWHGTDNRRRRGARTALLVQYAAADRAVRIPDWDELDWPFRIRSEALPPVIVVSGAEQNGANHVVLPPTGWSGSIQSTVHAFDQPLETEPLVPWRPLPAFHGTTDVVDELSCHASVLAGGHSPHPPHAHAEEEILIPLHGEVEAVVAVAEDDPEPRLVRLAPGSFVYYPARRWHTIRNPGASPVAYLMLKWRAPDRGEAQALGIEIIGFDDAASESGDAFSTRLLLEGPTDCLARLHSHLTTLRPGAGYEPHADAHDVAIVLLEGEIETLGRRVHPASVVYCSAGELHGMHNPGPEPARYLVFELHGTERRGSAKTIRARVAAKLRRARARRP